MSNFCGCADNIETQDTLQYAVNNLTYHEKCCFLAFTWTTKATYCLKYNMVIFSYLEKSHIKSMGFYYECKHNVL